MASGEESAIVKQEIEAELRRYVKEQRVNDPLYLEKNVSTNAYNGMEYEDSLNECIADVLILESNGIVKDNELLRLVRRCIK